MIYHIRELFIEHARSECFEISNLLFRTKMVEERSSMSHALKMNGYIDLIRSVRICDGS